MLLNPAATYADQAEQIASPRFRKGFEACAGYIFMPIVMVLSVLTLVSVALGMRQAKYILTEGAVSSPAGRGSVVFLPATLGFLIIAIVDAALKPDYAAADREFSRFFARVPLPGSLILLVQMRHKPATHAMFEDREVQEVHGGPQGLWPTLAWFFGLLLLTMTLGFVLALAVVPLLFFRFWAGLGWMRTGACGGGGIAASFLLAAMPNQDFPSGLVQDTVRLPWPLT